MPLTYSQWIWGLEVFDATAGSAQNNSITFTRGATFTVTLAAGVYSPDELAAQVASAMNNSTTGDPGNSYAVSFSYASGLNALKFVISGTNSFTLKKSVANGPWGLLGFSSNDASGTSFTSDSIIGTSPSTSQLWTAAEPLVFTSPVAAQPAGTSALLAQRAVNTRQHVTDGATVESVYVATLKRVQVGFRALLPSEQTKMERFLDWAIPGKRFTWQPDKTSDSVLKLVLANPGQIGPMFEWLTRQETGYGTLSFFEQLS